MTQDQLDLMVNRTGADRLRAVTADDWPDAAERDMARVWVEEMSTYDQWPPDLSYPPIAEQIGNAAKAAVKFVASGCATVDQAEYDRRRATCESCEFMDKARNRCTKCGCSIALKPWSRAESCPEGKW